MPNYDYECQECGKRFEVFQSMNEAKLTACQDEKCGGPVKRLLGTGGGILFKGSGFYQTDYRSSSYHAGSKAEGGSNKADGTAANSASPASAPGTPAAAAPTKSAE